MSFKEYLNLKEPFDVSSDEEMNQIISLNPQTKRLKTDADSDSQSDYLEGIWAPKNNDPNAVRTSNYKGKWITRENTRDEF